MDATLFRTVDFICGSAKRTREVEINFQRKIFADVYNDRRL